MQVEDNAKAWQILADEGWDAAYAFITENSLDPTPFAQKVLEDARSSGDEELVKQFEYLLSAEASLKPRRAGRQFFDGERVVMKADVDQDVPVGTLGTIVALANEDSDLWDYEVDWDNGVHSNDMREYNMEVAPETPAAPGGNEPIQQQPVNWAHASVRTAGENPDPSQPGEEGGQTGWKKGPPPLGPTETAQYLSGLPSFVESNPRIKELLTMDIKSAEEEQDVLSKLAMEASKYILQRVSTLWPEKIDDIEVIKYCSIITRDAIMMIARGEDINELIEGIEGMWAERGSVEPDLGKQTLEKPVNQDALLDSKARVQKQLRELEEGKPAETPEEQAAQDQRRSQLEQQLKSMSRRKIAGWDFLK